MTSLYNINYLQHLCKKYGLIPSRKYGQNFLINPEPIAKMMEAAAVKKDDVVVEVGPGFGVLTLALSEKAKKVMTFEIEKKLMPYWQEQLKKNKNIEIIWGNVMSSVNPRLGGVGVGEVIEPIGHSSVSSTHGLEASPAQAGIANKYKVVANLPYQITSEVIRKFLEMEHKPEVMVFMAQKEVAERICAKPGDMSVLAVSVQRYADPEIVMYVPKSYFWPVPGVDSAVIKITPRDARPHPTLPLKGEESNRLLPPFKEWLGEVSLFDRQFFKIVKAGFANRRKMLIKNLSSVTDEGRVSNDGTRHDFVKSKKLPAIFQELGINEKVRAQELSVEQWRELVHKVESL